MFVQVVSNLPFNISTDVVKLLLPMGDIFSKVVLLLQVKQKLFSSFLKDFPDAIYIHCDKFCLLANLRTRQLCDWLNQHCEHLNTDPSTF